MRFLALVGLVLTASLLFATPALTPTSNPQRTLSEGQQIFRNAATLEDVVSHYNRERNLQLTAVQQRDLVEFLKSL